MSENKQQPRQAQPDPALDVPADANTQKHMNYTAEADSDNGNEDTRTNVNDRDNPRRQQWEQGLEEGRAQAEPHRSGQADNNAPPDSTAGIP